ncbi:MAG: ATP-binding protein [Chitinophagales bacterium]
MLKTFSKIIPKDIPPQYQKGFRRYIRQQNLQNIILFCWLMLGIHLLFLLTDFFHYTSGDWVTSPSYKTLFYFHLAVYPIFGTVLLISNIFEKKIKRLSPVWKDRLVMIFIYVTGFWFIGVAVYDQLLHEKITLYLLFIFVPGVLFTLKRRSAFIAQMYGYFFLATGLCLVQPEMNKIIGHLVNAAGFATIGYFIAFYYWRARGNNYVREQLLKEKTKELKEVNGELKRFVYAVSHDLKAPLRMVNSFTNLLERSLSKSLKGEEREYMTYITNGTKRMNLLLDDLRDYAMVNRSNISPETIDLNLVVHQVKQNLHVNIEESDASIDVSDLPAVKAVFTHMLQLFQNLISNAIKFRDEDTPEVVIQSKERLNDYLISVSDNGIGIEKEYVDQVFTLFKRLHTEEEYEGTGIGLALCQKIIMNYGGEIWLDSELNKGTTFYFTFPKLEVAA